MWQKQKLYNKHPSLAKAKRFAKIYNLFPLQYFTYISLGNKFLQKFNHWIYKMIAQTQKKTSSTD